MTEKVYQASPATCVSVARESLDTAASHLVEGGDWALALEAVRTARAWLPSWLIAEWDDQMADWLERTNRSPRKSERGPHPATMIGKRSDG